MKASRWALSVVLATAAATAFALPNMVADFHGAYKVNKTSALSKAGCKVCHTVGAKLNPYGEDLKKALAEAKTKKLSADIFKKVETLDSDKDSVKNLDEIKADKNPGDPKDTPPKK
jgi:hypothetical protein